MSMMKQPLFNLGTLGSVSSGKSTCIKSLTGENTQKQSSEKVRNITIKAGYANMKIWEKDGELKSTNSKINDFGVLKTHLSFIDCPGHQELTQVMLGQVGLMRGAIVIISMIEDILTNSQLIEHLMAAKLANINKLIVCLNKCDLITKLELLKKKKEVDLLFSKLHMKYLDIIPTSFNFGINVDFLLKSIMNNFDYEEKIASDEAFMYISRSFDINKPGTEFDKIKGGVVGGSIVRGELKVGDTVYIKPGIIGKSGDKIINIPIETTIKNIKTDEEVLDKAHSGGLIALELDFDANFTKADKMVGSVVVKNKDVEVDSEINVCMNIVGEKLKINDNINLIIGPLNINAKIIKIKKNNALLSLTRPTFLDYDTKIFITKNIGGVMKIMGYATLITPKY